MMEEVDYLETLVPTNQPTMGPTSEYHQMKVS